MDIRTSKKQQFDAFHGNSLVKSSSKHNTATSKSTTTMKSNISLTHFDHVGTYDFDELWRGSVSNLMSSDNITEDLIKDSIKELENAMQESKRMLHERDEEIQKLREAMDTLKAEREREEDEKYPSILNEYKETQTRVMELECQLRQINIAHAHEVEQLRATCATQNKESGTEGCTCACGNGCQALADLNETKVHLETSRTKYENLKRKVREFRKQMEMEQKEEEEKFNMEGKNMASCTLQ